MIQLDVRVRTPRESRKFVRMDKSSNKQKFEHFSLFFFSYLTYFALKFQVQTETVGRVLRLKNVGYLKWSR